MASIYTCQGLKAAEAESVSGLIDKRKEVMRTKRLLRGRVNAK